MAKARITGSTGAFATTTNVYGQDFASWTLRASHQVDEDTSYADTLGASSFSGCGTVSYVLDAAGFLNKGATNAGPKIGSVAAAVPVISDVDGAAITATADSSCTFAGVGIVQSASISHSKKSGAIPISYTFVIDGDLTEAWVVA